MPSVSMHGFRTNRQAISYRITGKGQVHPNVGPVEYPWRGVTMKRGSQPHMLWMFAHVQHLASELDDESAGRFTDLLERTGGSAAMAIALAKNMERKANILVLV